jgi:hypothetical protein
LTLRQPSASHQRQELRRHVFRTRANIRRLRSAKLENIGSSAMLKETSPRQSPYPAPLRHVPLAANAVGLTEPADTLRIGVNGRDSASGPTIYDARSVKYPRFAPQSTDEFPELQPINHEVNFVANR